jgi:hypothetical protein
MWSILLFRPAEVTCSGDSAKARAKFAETEDFEDLVREMIRRLPGARCGLRARRIDPGTVMKRPDVTILSGDIA